MKSRALLPRDVEVDEDELDPRLDLVRQLLAYKRFNTPPAASTCAPAPRRAASASARPPRTPGPRTRPSRWDLFALVDAFRRLLKETGDDTVVATPRERLPITHFVGIIFERLVAEGGSMSFRALVGAKPDRGYVIGAFLALLELVKLRKVRVVQESATGDIAVRSTRTRCSPRARSTATSPAAQALEASEPKTTTGLRVVFMGSPAFAVPALRSLCGAGMAPVLVVTQPDREAGRGKRLRATAVALAAGSTSRSSSPPTSTAATRATRSAPRPRT